MSKGGTNGYGAGAAERPGGPATRPPDLGKVKLRLHENGQRLTRLKREIIEALAGADGAVTVDEITRSLGREEDPSPLYRCLTGLEQARIVTQVGLGDGVRRYALHEGFGHHHDYLVCNHCAAVEEVAGCLLVSDAARIADDSGYLIEGHQVILRGLCPKCRRERGKTPCSD